MASTTGEEGNELAVGTANNSPRVPVFAECAEVSVRAVGKDWGFGGIEGTGEAVDANFGLEPTQTANGCSRGGAIFYNKPHGKVVKVFGGRMNDLFSGEDTPEFEEMTIQGVVEIELVVDLIVHHAHKFAGVDLHTWNGIS